MSEIAESILDSSRDHSRNISREMSREDLDGEGMDVERSHSYMEDFDPDSEAEDGEGGGSGTGSGGEAMKAADHKGVSIDTNGSDTNTGGPSPPGAPARCVFVSVWVVSI